MPQLTNTDRADRAYRALLSHYMCPGMSNNVEAAVIEFLIDIQHEFHLHRDPGELDSAIIAARRNFLTEGAA